MRQVSTEAGKEAPQAVAEGRKPEITRRLLRQVKELERKEHSPATEPPEPKPFNLLGFSASSKRTMISWWKKEQA